MVFSSLVFLFVFLPIVLIGYHVLPVRFKNVFLFIASIIFFAWGGASYSVILIGSIIINYFLGRAIAFTSKPKTYLIVGLVINLLLLVVFKYAGFLTEFLNIGLSANNQIPIPKILLPIGISFYTFQALSYLVDVYRKETVVQKNFVNLGLYISLFPQLIAGPIVRYHDIAEQLKKRSITLDKFVSGICRFVLGLGKKVLIANNMALVADHVFSLTPENLSLTTAWIGILAYSLQIYFDFSGYSDMAIGLGRMFGFELLENFNLPYISKSIREFWRRWHISLSNWFRDYLYIPLGGNRTGRTYYNLLIVFFITGLWHGASWNFVLWGLSHGLLIIIERLGFSKILKKLPKYLQHVYTILFVVLAWVLFRSESFAFTKEYYKALFNFSDFAIKDVTLYFVLNNEFFFFGIIGLVGAIGFFTNALNRFKIIIAKRTSSFYVWLVFSLKMLFIVTVFFLCTAYLANSTYNPFIYFRF